jgi:hypothetical protein
MKIVPSEIPLSLDYLVGTLETLNLGLLEHNPWSRFFVLVSCILHISPENPFSIVESRRNVFVQDSGNENGNSCQKDYHNGNTSNSQECKVLVRWNLIVEKGSFGFIL